ncbi:MAG: hypothetical protein FWH02_06865, partial [Oscillospiraceae bacterium]|nr:hypothetical protein [Oscillospiraceae bacterium]
GMEQLGLDALPATDLYVPVGSGHAANMGIIQSSWQNTLGVYINIAAIPPEEISERLGTGDFRLMLMPIVPENEKAHTALNFSRGRFGYNNPRVDELISYGINAADLNTAVFRISQAERTLLADAVAIPAYHETTYFAAGKDAHGATPSPFGGMVYFGG